MPGQSVTLDNPWKQRNWNKSVLYLQATIVTPLEMGKHFIPPPQKSKSMDTSEGDVTTLLNQTDKIIDEEEFADTEDDDDVDDDDDDESLQILDFRGGNILTATSVDSFDAADLLQNDMEFNDAPTSKSGKKKRILAGKKLKTSDRTNDTDYSNEYRIKKQLLSNYDKSTRPVRNDTTPITLFIGMSLYHILDTVRTPITSTNAGIVPLNLSIQGHDCLIHHAADHASYFRWHVLCFILSQKPKPTPLLTFSPVIERYKLYRNGDFEWVPTPALLF